MITLQFDSWKNAPRPGIRLPVIERGSAFQRSERGPRTFAVKTMKQDLGRRGAAGQGAESAIRGRAEEKGGGERSMQRGNEKRKKRSERRGALVRREVAGGITERIVSLNVRGAPGESLRLVDALRPSPSLARGDPLAGWHRRGCRGRTKLAAISSRFRARSGTTVAPPYTSWWGTPPRLPPGASSTQRWVRGGGGREASFFFYAAWFRAFAPGANRNGSYVCICKYTYQRTGICLQRSGQGVPLLHHLPLRSVVLVLVFVSPSPLFSFPLRLRVFVPDNSNFFSACYVVLFRGSW